MPDMARTYRVQAFAAAAHIAYPAAVTEHYGTFMDSLPFPTTPSWRISRSLHPHRRLPCHAYRRWTAPDDVDDIAGNSPWPARCCLTCLLLFGATAGGGTCWRAPPCRHPPYSDATWM